VNQRGFRREQQPAPVGRQPEAGQPHPILDRLQLGHDAIGVVAAGDGMHEPRLAPVVHHHLVLGVAREDVDPEPDRRGQRRGRGELFGDAGLRQGEAEGHGEREPPAPTGSHSTAPPPPTSVHLPFQRDLRGSLPRTALRNGARGSRYGRST
jgi:hypothetical protein